MPQKRDGELHTREFELEGLDQGGTAASYQCPRTSSNKTNFVDIHQVRINQINILQNRQPNSNFLSMENGIHNKPNNDSFINRDLGSFVGKEHNYFSQIPSQCSKQGGRLGVTKQQGISRLETVSSNLSKKQVSAWSSPNRSVCITSMLSARKLYFLETRPIQQGGGCNAIYFLSFLLDSKIIAQDSTGLSSYNDSCNTSLADATLVPQASTIINSQSNHHTTYAKSTVKFTKGDSSVSGKQNIKVRGLKSFRESLIDSGLLESATSLSPELEGQVQTQITTRPRENGLAGALEKT